MTLHWRNYSDLVRDTLLLAPKLARCGHILGVPRSGIIPATVLALHMGRRAGIANLGVADGGARLGAVSDFRPLAIVDDSCLTGAAMRKAAEHYAADVVRACVYVYPDAKAHVDAWAVELPAPRLFEWNLFGSETAGYSLLDIDGVLCPDPPMPEDDAAAYADYLASAPVLYRPVSPVAGLVTNRLERHRVVTETWLASNGIAYGTLRMAPFSTPQARRRMSTPAALKAAWYSDHDCRGILIESDDFIGQQVAAATGRPVITTQSMRCWQ